MAQLLLCSFFLCLCLGLSAGDLVNETANVTPQDAAWVRTLLYCTLCGQLCWCFRRFFRGLLAKHTHAWNSKRHQLFYADNVTIVWLGCLHGRTSNGCLSVTVCVSAACAHAAVCAAVLNCSLTTITPRPPPQPQPTVSRSTTSRLRLSTTTNTSRVRRGGQLIGRYGDTSLVDANQRLNRAAAAAVSPLICPANSLPPQHQVLQ